MRWVTEKTCGEAISHKSCQRDFARYRDLLYSGRWIFNFQTLEPDGVDEQSIKFIWHLALAQPVRIWRGDMAAIWQEKRFFAALSCYNRR
jgi:hypothetical protein